jgi:hypothetical protein
MQPHRLGHLRAEMLHQPGMAEQFMLVINASIGRVIAQIVHEVANIMQQRGCDHGIAQPILLGQPSGL